MFTYLLYVKDFIVVPNQGGALWILCLQKSDRVQNIEAHKQSEPEVVSTKPEKHRPLYTSSYWAWIIFSRQI